MLIRVHTAACKQEWNIPFHLPCKLLSCDIIYFFRERVKTGMAFVIFARCYFYKFLDFTVNLLDTHSIQIPPQVREMWMLYISGYNWASSFCLFVSIICVCVYMHPLSSICSTHYTAHTFMHAVGVKHTLQEHRQACLHTHQQ